jgi:hypothetical protein
MARFSNNPNAGGVGRSEHVSLETDISETRAKPNPSKPLLSYELNKGGRGVTRRVSILPDQYVAIETQRSRSTSSMHTVDLRFVEPRSFRIRNVPWRLLYVAIGATVLTTLAFVLCAEWPKFAQKFGGLLAAYALATVTVGCYAVCYYLTIESLHFLSANGRASVIVIAGRWGTMRRAQSCAVDLLSHIKVAQKKFGQTRQTYLRDEMREHARLFEAGVLSIDQYNDAKRRILKSHE